MVLSRPCARRLQARGVHARRISVVLNPGAPPPRAAPEPERPPFLVTHTTLVPRYGVDVAIRALAELAPAWPALTLRVIGDGEARPAPSRLGAQLGPAGPGRLPGKPPLPGDRGP